MSKTMNDLLALRDVKAVDAKEIRWLWHCGYWDGPLSGIVLFQGAEAWVDCFDEIFATASVNENPDDDVGTRVRRFAIVRPTPEELAQEKEEHALFEKYVGLHTSYDADGKRPVGAVRPSHMHDEFYKREHKPRDYTGHEVVAYFEV